jgi:hypothetical protein
MSRVESRQKSLNIAEKPGRYLLALGAFTAMGFAALWQGNRAFAPEMYSRQGVVEIAEAFAKGRNYAVFDLNINIRELRDEHIKRMTRTPDVAVLGASHWQEAHDWLIQHKTFYNAHVHRDYYEDILGVTEMFVKHDRLPKQLIIAIRDNLFTPVADRKDHLWLPGVPYYEAMAKRLGIAAHPAWQTAPYARWRELASLPMFHSNASRWANATFRPRRTFEAEHSSLDTLLPGGSIVWSHEHQALFTHQRTREEADSFAKLRINQIPQIDPKGVEHIDKLLQFLKDKGVEVFLAHPPFNPDYYKQVMKGPYAQGLRKVEELTQNFADKYGWQVIGSFDPGKLGCESRMFIDAEHGSPECLSKLFNQYIALDKAKTRPDSNEQSIAVSDANTAGQSVRHRIAVAVAGPQALYDGDHYVPQLPVSASAQPAGIVLRPQAPHPASSVITPPVEAAVSSVDARKKPLRKIGKSVPATVRYPFRSKTVIAKATQTGCSPYVWPGDHVYADRLKSVCAQRGLKVQGR